MRFIFNNNQFIEYSLNLEEIKKAKENMDLKESKETFGGLSIYFQVNQLKINMNERDKAHEIR